jgi:DNA (cytosine-5)-methyltransferase 1
MENVPGLLRSREYTAFVRSLGSSYMIEEKILDAADYGVPQRRKRAIVIGSRIGPIAWPEPTHAAPAELSGDLRPWLTVHEAIGDLPRDPDNRHWHRARRPTALSELRYRSVPYGGNRFDLAHDRPDLTPRCWLEKPTGSTDVFGRLVWERPAVTIRTEFYKPEKGRYLHPVAHRPITVREAARLMTFPDSFVFPEEQSMTSVARQLGNAVPPLLARHIATACENMMTAALEAARARSAAA